MPRVAIMMKTPRKVPHKDREIMDPLLLWDLSLFGFAVASGDAVGFMLSLVVFVYQQNEKSSGYDAM